MDNPPVTEIPWLLSPEEKALFSGSAQDRMRREVRQLMEEVDYPTRFVTACYILEFSSGEVVIRIRDGHAVLACVPALPDPYPTVRAILTMEAAHRREK